MKSKKTYVYALDLALNSSGVCIFDNDGGFVEAKTIDTSDRKETRLKLKMIGEEFLKIKKSYPPSVIVIEQGFTRYNLSTQAVFRCHGLVNYLFSDYEQIYYPATTVKKSVVGKGNATKEEVQDAILYLYPGLRFQNFDESDAFSVGMTFFMKRKERGDA
jgi:Holliday junction resolvasome RuvABC endonuclease subunit